MTTTSTLTRWRVADVVALYDLLFNDLLYRAQTVHRETGLKTEKLMEVDDVLKAAEVAKANGAPRFCMGAA